MVILQLDFRGHTLHKDEVSACVYSNGYDIMADEKGGSRAPLLPYLWDGMSSSSIH